MKAFAPGAILLAMLLAACQPAADAPSPATAPAEPAATGAEPAAPAQDAAPAAAEDAPKPEIPALDVATIDGGRFDLAEHRGKWVVVNFWATWCSPCLKEMPELSALDGVSPDDLNVDKLLDRLPKEEIGEVILALPATVDGQITSHYLVSRLKEHNVKITTLAQGIPVGAELDYMDEGTIQLAINSRKEM